MNMKQERNQEIVDLIENHGFTLQDIADKYGFKRQRTEQIYKRYGNKSYAEVLEERRIKQAIQDEAEAAKHAKEVKFSCAGCGRKVTYGELPHQIRHKYCDACLEISKSDRDPSVTLFCKVCEKPFHPHKNYKYYAKLPKYCSSEHRDQDCKSFLAPTIKALIKANRRRRLSVKEVSHIREVFAEARANKVKPLGKVVEQLAEEYKRSVPTLQQVVYKQKTYKDC